MIVVSVNLLLEEIVVTGYLCCIHVAVAVASDVAVAVDVAVKSR